MPTRLGKFKRGPKDRSYHCGDSFQVSHQVFSSEFFIFNRVHSSDNLAQSQWWSRFERHHQDKIEFSRFIWVQKISISGTPVRGLN